MNVASAAPRDNAASSRERAPSHERSTLNCETLVLALHKLAPRIGRAPGSGARGVIAKHGRHHAPPREGVGGWSPGCSSASVLLMGLEACGKLAPPRPRIGRKMLLPESLAFCWCA
eukprot:CAMPEP_0185187166 /NCGR_PEP_ID=MMETSP1140-20130426/4549_1 /TAXON_ID=298111 /ORGANISM="Pavlova sp., Strain CCMP459" /LENGTH=115 /DNA_ID=CAMNT_0027753525 /DNA_START=682 /DNA_END=1029 /DNA_ORIENTATION=-